RRPPRSSSTGRRLLTSAPAGPARARRPARRGGAPSMNASARTAHDDQTADLVRRVRVTRQGVYDARRRLVGYRAAFSIAAVPGHTGDPARAALAEVADFVSLSVAALPPLVVPGLVAACRAGGATLIAAVVEDAGTFAHCVELGFDLFEGRYLQRPMLLER